MCLAGCGVVAEAYKFAFTAAASCKSPNVGSYKSLVDASLGFKVDNQDVLTPLLNKMLECGSSSGRGVAPRLPARSLPDLLHNGLKIASSHVVSM